MTVESAATLIISQTVQATDSTQNQQQDQLDQQDVKFDDVSSVKSSVLSAPKSLNEEPPRTDSEATIVNADEDNIDEQSAHAQEEDIEEEQEQEHEQNIIPDRIFVGNLPYEVTEDDVRNLTPEFEVVSVEIPRKHFLNRHLNEYVLQSKGYGFITYTNAEDAKQAIGSIVGKLISGREIYAKYALPQNKSKFRSLSNANGNVNGNIPINSSMHFNGRHGQFPTSFKTKSFYYGPMNGVPPPPPPGSAPGAIPYFFPGPPPGAYPMSGPMGPMMTPIAHMPPMPRNGSQSSQSSVAIYKAVPNTPSTPTSTSSLETTSANTSTSTPSDSTLESTPKSRTPSVSASVDLKSVKPFFPIPVSVPATSTAASDLSMAPNGAYIYAPSYPVNGHHQYSHRNSHGRGHGHNTGNGNGNGQVRRSQRGSQSTASTSKEEKLKRLENGKPSATIVFIGNLDRYITNEELGEYLSPHNPVSIKIPRQNIPHEIYRAMRADGVKIQNRGIAFVKFANHNVQRQVIEEFNGKVWNGKKLNVAVAINADDDDDNDAGDGDKERDENAVSTCLNTEVEVEAEAGADAETDIEIDIKPETGNEAEEEEEAEAEEEDTEIEVVVSDDN
jgi:RNA recognition motif-containing protein